MEVESGGKGCFGFFRGKKSLGKSSNTSSPTNSTGRSATPMDSTADSKTKSVSAAASSNFTSQIHTTKKTMAPKAKVVKNTDIKGISIKKFMTDQEKSTVEKNVNDYRNVLSEVEEMKMNQTQRVAHTENLEKELILKLKEEDARLVGKMNEFEQALQDLPKGWEKTRHNDQAYETIATAIIHAIITIEKYREDFKGVTWNRDMDARENDVLLAMTNAEKLINLVEVWKTQ